MANHRNRILLNCVKCNKLFEIIKSRINKSKRHFCSTNCRNTFCGQEKRLNKYPKIVGICKYCNKDIIAQYMAMDKPWRKFCSYICKTIWRNKNIPQTTNQRRLAGERLKNRDMTWTEERRIKWAESLKGDKSQFWKGGLTDKNRNHRNSVHYAIWREKIFARDNWTCQICNIRGGVILNADHIKSWALYPDLRFELSNGRTLCLSCHLKTDNFGVKANFNSNNYSKI